MIELGPARTELPARLHVTALTAVTADTRRLGLDHLLAADTYLTGSDAELLVLASETTFLVALELLELLLQAVGAIENRRQRCIPAAIEKENVPLLPPLVLPFVVRGQQLVRLKLLLVDDRALVDICLNDGRVANDLGLPLAVDLLGKERISGR